MAVFFPLFDVFFFLIQLAQNQTKLIKQTAEEVFDAYIENLVKSIGKLQEAASKVREAFLPIERAFRGLTEGLGVGRRFCVFTSEFSFA